MSMKSHGFITLLTRLGRAPMPRRQLKSLERAVASVLEHPLLTLQGSARAESGTQDPRCVRYSPTSTDEPCAKLYKVNNLVGPQFPRLLYALAAAVHTQKVDWVG